MKKTLSILLVLSAAVALADSAQVAARQRWPFSRVVDVDVKLDAAGCADSTLTATYEGAAEPIDLSSGIVEGSTMLRPGLNHLVWDPVAAGLGENKLKGFTVTATLASFDSRKFLAIDLKMRTYAYYAEDPDGKDWSDNRWKTRYVVFRRVPAGIYHLGYTSEQMARYKDLGAGQGYRGKFDAAYAPRTVVITKDYYIAIYQTTSGQASAICWHSETSTGSVGYKNYYYDEKYVEASGCDNPTKSTPAYWRGDGSDPSLNCAWPQDGHSVTMPVCEQTVGKSTGSLVGRFRQLMINGPQNLPPNMIIDLPTEVQWEVANRAGQSTFYSDCGTLTDDAATITAYQDAHFVAGKNTAVGTLLPNSWGLYDVMGINYEATINTFVCDATKTSVSNRDAGPMFDASQTVDPVGITCEKTAGMFLITCNVGWGSHGISYDALPASRTAWRMDAGSSCTARLCIHLK